MCQNKKPFYQNCHTAFDEVGIAVTEVGGIGAPR